MGLKSKASFEKKHAEHTAGEREIYGADPGAIEFSAGSPGFLALLICSALAVVLVLYYLIYIKVFVTMPADILMWAETNFVGDLIKLRTGSPIYTAPGDNNSLIYTPGAPILTYAISWIIGKSTSIAAWRSIQLGYIFCAALVATMCVRRLSDLAAPDIRIPFSRTWSAFCFLALFLAATAPNINKFAHCLHTDALALLVSICSFWTMIFYLKAPSVKRLLLMAICPAIGYFVKEFLIAWSAVMFIFLFLDNPGNVKRLILFTSAATLFILAVAGGCYLMWGDNYLFWTFKVMGGARKQIGISPAACNISLARSLDHTIRAWMEIAIGLVGGALALREENLRRLGPLWASWIVLIGLEAFSSGAGWGVLYHFGPGVLIGMVWTLSALSKIWPWTQPKQGAIPALNKWFKPVGAVAFVLTIFVALHVIPNADANEARNWKQRPTPNIYSYLQEIEREFDGFPPEKVLLDIGNWVYLRSSTLAKDRAISLADQPCNSIFENFDVMISRIRNKTYDKILVHDFHSPFFIYDYSLWHKSSGVRKALLENYTEIRTINLTGSQGVSTPMIMFLGPVSVLVPKSEAPNNENNVAGEKQH